MTAEPTPLEYRLIGGPVRALVGHTNKVTCLAWASDGSCLASGSDDATIRLWKIDAHTPAAAATAPAHGNEASKVLRGHTAVIDALAWSPTEPHILASAASDRSIRFWDSRGAGGVDAILTLPGGVLHMAYKADGSTLAVGTREDELVLVDVRGGRPAVLGRTPFSMQLNELAWAPSGLLFVACTLQSVAADEGYVVVFRVNDDGKGVTPVLQTVAHTIAANSLCFDRTFRFFATGGSDSVVGLWDAADVACIRTFDRLETIVRGVGFSHDSQYLATASDDKIIELIRVSDGTRVRAVPTVDPVNAVSWAPHAHLLAFACDDERAPRAEHHTVRVLVPAPP